MIRKLLKLTIVLTALLLFIPSPVPALLMNIESGGVTLVYDDVTKEYWQPDLRRHHGNLALAMASVDADNVALYGLVGT